MNNKAVIFDFFGVISSEVAPAWFQKYFGEEQATDLKEKYVLPADLGEISYKQLTQQLAHVAGIEEGSAKEEWEGQVVLNDRVISLIQKIKSSCKIGLLSDAPSEFLRAILRENKLEDLFDAIIISSEVKTTKKDKEIYTLALTSLNVDAPQALFIDDNENNIKIAETLGMKCCLYTGEEELTEELIKKLLA